MTKREFAVWLGLDEQCVCPPIDPQGCDEEHEEWTCSDCWEHFLTETLKENEDKEVTTDAK